MSKTLLWSFAVSVLALSLAFAGGTKKKGTYQEPLKENQPISPNAPYTRVPDPDWSRMTSDVGTFTTLTGFYDYQSNGGAIQQLRVNPANGNIHVTFMLADDSTAGGLNNARRVAYAFSSNNGLTWNNFSNLRVPSRRSGFPTIDLLRGTNAGLPVIANHSTVGADVVSTIFIDSPEGTGAFSEISAPPNVTGGVGQPIWPYIAGASDGSVVMATSQNDQATTVGVAFYNRIPNDFSGWPAYTTFSGSVQSGGRYPVQANGTGRVGLLLNTSNGTAVLGNRWIESTDNGLTWTAPVNLYATRTAGADSFNSWVHADFVYNGNTPLFAFSEYNAVTGLGSIVFWSQATGFKQAVPWDPTKYTDITVDQRFHSFNPGWPSIGLSGSTIVVAYQAFQPDTDRLGYNFSNLWYVASTNSGNTWGGPQRITNTANVDERYPSVSKYNASGQFNMVWTQKNNRSGLYAFPGAADTVRASQVFLRVTPIVVTSVEEDGGGVANSFKLSQNYPNPFNPATKIDYTVAQSGPVSIKVYNTLGQEVATLLNENLSPGTYQVTFDGGRLSSGVYMYTMRAGSYTESKKMVYMK